MPVGSSALSWGRPLLRRNHPPENGYSSYRGPGLSRTSYSRLPQHRGHRAQQSQEFPVSTQERRRKSNYRYWFLRLCNAKPMVISDLALPLAYSRLVSSLIFWLYLLSHSPWEPPFCSSLSCASTVYKARGMSVFWFLWRFIQQMSAWSQSFHFTKHSCSTGWCHHTAAGWCLAHAKLGGPEAPL